MTSSPKIHHGGSRCAGGSTMEIRNHLTPERDDQCYKVTVYVSKGGQLKVNTWFLPGGGVGTMGDHVLPAVCSLRWRWECNYQNITHSLAPRSHVYSSDRTEFGDNCKVSTKSDCMHVKLNIYFFIL